MTNPKAHFVLIPLMAQGHIIPMIDLAHVLSSHGVLVTYITTPFNASRIRPTIDHAREAGLLIRFIELPFPCEEVGLPEGCEHVDVLPRGELLFNFFNGMSLLARPIEEYLRQQKPLPTCMIADSSHHWAHEVATKLQIPRLSFYSVSSFALLCLHNIFCHEVYERITDEHEPFVVPGLPQEIVVTKAQAPRCFGAPGFEKIRKKFMDAELAADGIIINTFNFLEPAYIKSYQEAIGKKIWAAGPFFLGNKHLGNMNVRGENASVDTKGCLSWLDSMRPKSVVYVCFGSVAFVTASQLMEIGLGLESSNHPFIWVIKKKECSPEVEEWLSKGFEERIASRGLIIKGWAPQVAIMSHPAVGGIMTHCGWNSTLEALCAGLPMITWPFFADQFLNERLIVDVLRIGVSVGVKEPGAWAKDDDNKALLASRNSVERALRSVMGDAKEAKERRERAEEVAEKASMAMKEGGSSYSSMKDLINYME